MSLEERKAERWLVTFDAEMVFDAVEDETPAEVIARVKKDFDTWLDWRLHRSTMRNLNVELVRERR